MWIDGKTAFFALAILQDLLILCLSVRGFQLRRERREAPRARLVSLSQVLLWVGLITSVILSVPVTISALGDMSVGIWLVLEAVALIGLTMLLAYCNLTVEYDKDGFTAGNLFGFKRRYAYRDITGLLHRGHDMLLYCGRRRILLDSMAQNADSFVNYADQMRRKQTGQVIPLRERRRDPMNGNLDTPWVYLVLCLFLIAMSATFFVLGINVLAPPDGELPEDAIERQTSFLFWERTKESSGTLLLYAPNEEKPYSIEWLDGFEVPLPEPDILCGGEQYNITAREGSEVWFVYALSFADGTPIFSAYDQDVAYRNTQRGAVVIVMIFCVIMFLFGIFGILVGRHPESYAPWFRKLFYQDWAWTSRRSVYRKKRRK